MKMNKIIKFGLAAICLLSMLCMEPAKAWADEVTTSAEEEGKDPFIVIERYELSHERIIPGNGFTLTLHLKNLSDTRSARQVLLDVANPKGVAPVYGTVSQVYLGDLGPGESRAVSFDYDSWTSITTETLDFSVAIVSDGNANGLTLRVPVGADSVFYVTAISGPSIIYADEMASASLNFRVLGEKNLNNVVLRMNCNGETVTTNQIGDLNAGTTETQSVSFKMTETGTFATDFYMEYLGPDGQNELEYLGSKVLEVKKAEVAGDVSSVDDTVEEEVNNTKIMILVLSGTLILAIFIVSAVIMKKKR